MKDQGTMRGATVFLAALLAAVALLLALTGCDSAPRGAVAATAAAGDAGTSQQQPADTTAKANADTKSAAKANTKANTDTDVSAKGSKKAQKRAANKSVTNLLEETEQRLGVELYKGIHESDEELALGLLETVEANDPNGLFASGSDVLDMVSIDRNKIAENTEKTGFSDYIHVPYGTKDESEILKMDREQLMRNLTWHIQDARGVLMSPIQYGSKVTFSDLDSMSWLEEDVKFWDDIQSNRKETFVINGVEYKDAVGQNRCVFKAEEDGAVCIRPTVRWRMLRLAYFFQGVRNGGFYTGQTVWNFHATHGNDPSRVFAELNPEQYVGEFHVYNMQLKGLAKPAKFFFNMKDRRMAYVVPVPKEEPKKEEPEQAPVQTPTQTPTQTPAQTPTTTPTTNNGGGNNGGGGNQPGGDQPGGDQPGGEKNVSYSTINNQDVSAAAPQEEGTTADPSQFSAQDPTEPENQTPPEEVIVTSPVVEEPTSTGTGEAPVAYDNPSIDLGTGGYDAAQETSVAADGVTDVNAEPEATEAISDDF